MPISYVLGNMVQCYYVYSIVLYGCPNGAELCLANSVICRVVSVVQMFSGSVVKCLVVHMYSDTNTILPPPPSYKE